jgi:hypothetical protein
MNSPNALSANLFLSSPPAVVIPIDFPIGIIARISEESGFSEDEILASRDILLTALSSIVAKGALAEVLIKDDKTVDDSIYRTEDALRQLVNVNFPLNAPNERENDLFMFLTNMGDVVSSLVEQNPQIAPSVLELAEVNLNEPLPSNLSWIQEIANEEKRTGDKWGSTQKAALEGKPEGEGPMTQAIVGYLSQITTLQNDLRQSHENIVRLERLLATREAENAHLRVEREGAEVSIAKRAIRSVMYGVVSGLLGTLGTSVVYSVGTDRIFSDSALGMIFGSFVVLGGAGAWVLSRPWSRY